MKKKLILLLMLLVMCGLTACVKDSAKAGDKAAKETEETDEEDDEDEDEDAESSKKKKKKKDKEKEKEQDFSEQFKQLEGSWQYVCRKTYSGDIDAELEEMDSNFFLGYDDDLYGYAEFYEEDGGWYADISESQYEYMSESYHFPAKIVNTPLYDRCENQEWHVIVENERKGEEVFQATLVGDNTLEIYYERSYEGEGNEESWRYVDIRTFFREGSEDLEHVDDLCYEKTVTVSDVGELLEAIDDNTRIILKPGDYDLSAYSEEIKNPKIEAYLDEFDQGEGYGSVTINDVEYLSLEVEGGGKAEISIDSPYSSVLHFNDCDRVVLDGLTCGHHVVPGSCGAPVLGMNNCYYFEVNNCHLYGCGSYGYEAYNCSSLNFNNTEIYECTYGIMYGYRCYNFNFNNCDFHDNKEYTQVDLPECSSFTFDGCSFTDNTVEDKNYYGGSFVGVNEADYIKFRNCDFKGNKYSFFSNGDVEEENCTHDDDIYDANP